MLLPLTKALALNLSSRNDAAPRLRAPGLWHNLPDDEPVKQHTNTGQMSLDCRSRTPPCRRSTYALHVSADRAPGRQCPPLRTSAGSRPQPAHKRPARSCCGCCREVFEEAPFHGHSGPPSQLLLGVAALTGIALINSDTVLSDVVRIEIGGNDNWSELHCRRSARNTRQAAISPGSVFGTALLHCLARPSSGLRRSASRARKISRNFHSETVFVHRPGEGGFQRGARVSAQATYSSRLTCCPIRTV